MVEIKDIEKANFDITIEVTGKILITLDAEYKGKIKLPVKIKGQDAMLRIPVELDEFDIENFKEYGFHVYEHTGLVLNF